MEYLGGVGKEPPQRGVERYFFGEIALPRISLPYVSDEAMGYLDSEEEDFGLQNDPDQITVELGSRGVMKNPTTDKLAYDPNTEEFMEDREESMSYIPIMKYIEIATRNPLLLKEEYHSPQLRDLEDTEQERFDFTLAA
jgi:hypothetical protein